MDDENVPVKRSRNPSGEDVEHGAKGRKVSRHHSMDDSVESGDHAEPMEVSDSMDETRNKTETVSQRPKTAKKGHGSASKQKTKTDYKHRISIEREQTIAQYKINIRLCKGSWRDKSYRDSAKGDLLECINAAGNSYGNNVVMDCSETEFGPKGELNTFYKAIEENELHDLVGEELVKKKATLEKELNLHVPMFKKFRSLKTNAFVPKFESVNMKNDDLCRAVLCDVKKGIRDGQKRLQIFTELEGQIKSDLEQLGYNAKINEGKESPAIQFKYLSPNKKQNLAKDCFNERNKLQKYVSAFATYNGGVILYGIEDGTGYAKGQILSSNKSDDHSFDKICETLKKEIPNHTLWWDCDIGYITASKAQMFFTICQYPIVATHIPENESRTLLPNEYLAVICIAIKPFVGSRDQQGPRDGTVFGSKDGAEGYRIDENLKKIHRLTFDEWLKAMRVQSTINDVAENLQRMHLSFDPVSDKVPVFQLHDSTKSIRDNLFKVTEDYIVYPKDFVPDRLSRSVKVKFQGDDSQGIILADKEKSGVYLFVISNKHGLYLYAIPSSRIYSEEYSDYDAEELKDQLQRKAIAFKASLCSKGGCTKDLEIRTQVIGDDCQIHIPESSRLTSLEVNSILDSYIICVGSFENQILKKQIGVEICNVLTESQFENLTQNINHRELWIHGLAGSGKTILAQLFMKRLVESGEGTVLYVAENQGLVGFMRKLVCDPDNVECMTRVKFMMKELDNLPAVRNIVMDEVHHYHYKKDKKDGAWLKKARQLISRNRPKDSNTEGYLWLFLDMYQKENKFATGIPPIHKQKSRVELKQIVRCTPIIWRSVKEKLNTVKILGAKADRLAEFYKDLLAESVSPHRIVIEDDISRIRSERSRDEFAIILQVACIISILRSQHWRAEDIAVLIPVVDKAAVFRSRYNSMTLSEKLIDCTADAEPEHCVCDSVRRFSGNLDYHTSLDEFEFHPDQTPDRGVSCPWESGIFTVYLQGEKYCDHSSAFIFEWIFFILASNKDSQKSLNVFGFLTDSTTDY